MEELPLEGMHGRFVAHPQVPQMPDLAIQRLCTICAAGRIIRRAAGSVQDGGCGAGAHPASGCCACRSLGWRLGARGTEHASASAASDTAAQASRWDSGGGAPAGARASHAARASCLARPCFSPPASPGRLGPSRVSRQTDRSERESESSSRACSPAGGGRRSVNQWVGRRRATRLPARLRPPRQLRCTRSNLHVDLCSTGMTIVRSATGHRVL